MIEHPHGAFVLLLSQRQKELKEEEKGEVREGVGREDKVRGRGIPGQVRRVYTCRKPSPVLPDMQFQF